MKVKWIMDYNLFVNELIRLFKENTKKLKYIDIEALNLVKNQMDKFHKKILIVWEYHIVD